MVDLPHATSATSVIRERALATPERTAVIYVDDVERADGDTRWSYARLDAEARRIGSWLQARFSVGDRVLLLYPTGFDFIAAYVACLYVGMVAVPAPLPDRYRHQQVRVCHIAQDADVSVVLTDTEDLPAVMEWAAAELATVPVRATDGDDLPDADSWTPVELDHQTLAMLQYTSGSTGEPKGVMVRHGNLLHNVHSQRRAFRLSAEIRGGWVPHYHDMGLLGQILPALMLGGHCVLMRSSAFLKQPHHWLKMIDKYDVSWSAAPNFVYELCCTRVTDEQLAGLDLSRWQVAATGTEPVDTAVLDAFAKRFAPAGLRDDALSPCYGMAEATVYVSGQGQRKAVVTRVDVAELRKQRFVPAAVGTDLVSCGPAYDSEVLIADPLTGAELAPGGIGEIWLRGPSLARAYWRNDAASERAFAADGYLRTGDLGILHEGELYVTGRVEELVTLHGRSFYPQEIEQELRAQHTELVSGGAVFSVPPTEAGDEDILVVTHEVHGRPTEDALRELALGIKDTVARAFDVPVGGVCLLRRGGVLRTTSGKIRRVAMRRLFLDSRLNPMYADYEPRVTELLRSRCPEPAAL